MKKKIALGLAGIMMMTALGGCGTAKSKYLLDIDYTDYVKLCDYKGAQTDKIIFEISDEEIDERIEEMLYEEASYKDITDRAVQDGDYVVIDYESKIDGKVSEDYSGEEEEISVGEEYFYPEAEDALIGMKIGEKKSVKVTLTDEFVEEEDVGKKLDMDITVKSISEEIIPEYNQTYVEENTDYDTMEEFEQSIRDDLNEEKEAQYESVSADGIMQYLIDNSTFDGYPKELYDQCEKYYDDSNEAEAAMYQMELEDYLELIGVDEKTKKEDVLANVNFELVIGAIAQKEGIDCTEEEIDNFAIDNYEDFGYEDSEAFFEEYSREEVGSELIYEKVIEFLLENAKYSEVPEEEYLKQEEAEEAE